MRTLVTPSLARPRAARGALAFLLFSAAVTALPHSALAQCQRVKVTAADAASGDSFGRALAMDWTSSGAVMVVGAPFDDTPQGSGAGSVYAFTRDLAGNWNQTAHFYPNDLPAGAGFGTSIAYRNTYLAVGVPGLDGDTSQGEFDLGGVYFYERSGGTWINKGMQRPSWASPTCSFGASVDLTESVGWAIVGAPNLDLDGNAALAGLQNPDTGGIAFYKRQPGGDWAYVSGLFDFDSTGSGAGQRLGRSVSISGDVAVAGAPAGQAPGKPAGSGYIKILRRSADFWLLQGPSRLAAPDAQAGAEFGSSVAASLQIVAVGAMNYDSTAAQTPQSGATTNAGCVYIYRWNPGASAWEFEAQLFASDAAANAQFGAKVKMNGAAILASSPSTGKVYDFRRVNGQWVQHAVYQAPEANAGFAHDFASMFDTVAIGAPDDDRPGLINAGAVHAFSQDSSSVASDSCAGAPSISPGSRSGCTTSATLDGSTTCGAGGTGPDVWYRWTASCAGQVEINTAGSSFDTVLSLHSACPAPGATATVACNDDVNGSLDRTSRIVTNVVAGQSYLIRIAGYGGARGAYNLHLAYTTIPANDSCANPTEVASGQVYSFSTCRASIEVPGPALQCNFVSVGDVWYRFFAPPGGGTLRLHTCGSNFDTVLSLYAGNGCPATFSSPIACNDDAPSADGCPNLRASRIQAQVSGGVPYTIRVAGNGDGLNPYGDGQLHVLFTPFCPADFNGVNGVTVQDIYDFLADFNAQAVGGNAILQSADFNGVNGITVQDIYDFLAAWNAGCP